MISFGSLVKQCEKALGRRDYTIELNPVNFVDFGTCFQYDLQYVPSQVLHFDYMLFNETLNTYRKKWKQNVFTYLWNLKEDPQHDLFLFAFDIVDAATKVGCLPHIISILMLWILMNYNTSKYGITRHVMRLFVDITNLVFQCPKCIHTSTSLPLDCNCILDGQKFRDTVFFNTIGSKNWN